MPVFPDESAQLYVSSGKYVIFPDRKTVLFLSHDVSGLPVSLTSYANFVVNEFFSVTVVNEMQVLLTTHESTNFSNLLFQLIRSSRYKCSLQDFLLNHFTMKETLRISLKLHIEVSTQKVVKVKAYKRVTNGKIVKVRSHYRTIEG